MKTCNKCLLIKDFTSFYKDRTKPDGFAYTCKDCGREQDIKRRRQYDKRNPTHRKTYDRKYYKDNEEIIKKRTSSWIRKNRERKRDYDSSYGKNWRQKNVSKRRANDAKRRAMLLQATPKWFEKGEVDAIYEKCYLKEKSLGIKYEVDHIVPLISKVVCGLHCKDNLRIITKEENQRKWNKLCLD